MSKHVKFLAGAALLAGVLVMPAGALAQHHHGGSYHGYHGGYHHGGWGGPHVYFGFGYPGYYGDPYYADPYYYYDPPPPPDCDWERVRVWSRGHWVWRNVRRCY